MPQQHGRPEAPPLGHPRPWRCLQPSDFGQISLSRSQALSCCHQGRPGRASFHPVPGQLQPPARSSFVQATLWLLLRLQGVRPARTLFYGRQGTGPEGVLTLWNSRRKERSYSPRQRSSILSLVTWCRVVVTASALTRSSRLSLCLEDSPARGAHSSLHSQCPPCQGLKEEAAGEDRALPSLASLCAQVRPWPSPGEEWVRLSG